MDWIKKLNDVLEYIEDNLDGDISHKVIAKKAECSIYNFQRMFSYIADKPLSEYIRNRRLTLAAFDILNSEGRIIDISLKYGYKSNDSFTRAFKSFHGVLPSTVRNETVLLKSCPKLSFQITIKGVNHMDYQIEKFPAFKVMGYVHRMKTSKAFEIVPGLWDEGWKNGSLQQLMGLLGMADYRPAGLLGIISGGAGGKSEEMDYIMGITNYVDLPECRHVKPLKDMKEFDYPATTWAIFRASGEIPHSVQNIHRQFYSEWLPNSGYRLADIPVIECYFPDRQEVWFAIEE